MSSWEIFGVGRRAIAEREARRAREWEVMERVRSSRALFQEHATTIGRVVDAYADMTYRPLGALRMYGDGDGVYYLPRSRPDGAVDDVTIRATMIGGRGEIVLTVSLGDDGPDLTELENALSAATGLPARTFRPKRPPVVHHIEVRASNPS